MSHQTIVAVFAENQRQEKFWCLRCMFVMGHYSVKVTTYYLLDDFVCKKISLSDGQVSGVETREPETYGLNSGSHSLVSIPNNRNQK